MSEQDFVMFAAYAALDAAQVFGLEIDNPAPDLVDQVCESGFNEEDAEDFAKYLLLGRRYGKNQVAAYVSAARRLERMN